jgi:hypothetical protein
VQRYFRSGAEMRAQSGPAQLIIAPNFRADWATAESRVEGVGCFLDNARFVAAAARLFGSDLVEPWGVYSNITWQLPFDQGGGHTDVPLVGIDRRRFPPGCSRDGPLAPLRRSASRSRRRWPSSTAGRRRLRYWPDGPDHPPRLHEGDLQHRDHGRQRP